MSGPLVGILLAAGDSRRFGSDKLLHPLADGRPLALAAALGLAAACDRAIAVVRPGREAVARILADAGCSVLVASESAQGMGRSLAAGVAASTDAAAWLVALADMPAIAPDTYGQVAAALRAGASLAAPSHGGRRGHPVGFGHRWYEELAGLQGDTGARAILAAHPQDLRLLPVADPGILMDVDRPEDLA